MKKFLFIAVLFTLFISLSFAFTDDKPKKANKQQCTEASAASGATCAHKPDSIACAKHHEASGKTCEKNQVAASDSCAKHKAMAGEACKEHQKMTADAKVKSSGCPNEATCKHHVKKSE